MVALTVRHTRVRRSVRRELTSGTGVSSTIRDQARAVAAAAVGDEPVGQAGHGHGLDVAGA